MARISTVPTAPALLIAALVLLLPGSAAAQSITVPPGQSEADQYFEVVPDGTGNGSLDSSAEPSDALTPKQVAALEALGGGGVATAQAAAATAPAGPGDGGRGGRGEPPGSGQSGAAAGAVVPGRDGLGGLLWLIMVGIVAGVGGYAIARRRGRGGP